MAYLTATRDPQLPFFYNVSAAVGRNAPNRRADVYLVQYLLKAVFEQHKLLGMSPLPSKAPFKVDGTFGPHTLEALMQFQGQLRMEKGANIVMDGRIDRCAPGTRTAASGTQYAIIFLNLAFKRIRPADYALLAAAPDCPSELAAALQA